MAAIPPRPSSNILEIFPSELFIHILHHLHDDKPSLKACSLVCPTWHALAPHDLFSDTTIYYNSKPTKLVEFNDFIQSTPTISSHIRTLRLAESRSAVASELNDKLLLSILSALPHLDSLYISWNSFYSLSWNPSPNTTQLPLLKKLYLWDRVRDDGAREGYPSYPLGFISWFPYIQTVVLDYPAIPNQVHHTSSGNLPDHTHIVPNVQDLHLQNPIVTPAYAHRMYSSLQDGLSLHSLKSISIDLRSVADVEGLEDFLSSSNLEIERIEIDPTRSPVERLDSILVAMTQNRLHLSHLKNLRSFTFTLQYMESASVQRMQQDLLIDLLAEIDSPLREVHIQIRNLPNIQVYPRFDLASSIDWHRLNSVLTALKERLLDSVTFDIVQGPYHWSGALYYWQKLVQTHLPSLYSSGFFGFACMKDNQPSFWD